MSAQLNEVESSTMNINKENIAQQQDRLLEEYIRHAAYETAFLVKEKHALEKRLKIYHAGRTEISEDPRYASKTKAKTDKIAKELENECERKSKQMRQSRRKVVKDFQTLTMKELVMNSKTTTESLERSVKDHYEQFLREYESDITSIRQLITDLYNEKIDQQEKEAMYSSLTQFRQSVQDVQQYQNEELEKYNEELQKELKTMLEKVKKEINEEITSNDVLPKVYLSMKDKVNKDEITRLDRKVGELSAAVALKHTSIKDSFLSWDESVLPTSAVLNTIKDECEAALVNSKQQITSGVLRKITSAQEYAEALGEELRERIINLSIMQLQTDVQEQQTVMSQLQTELKDLTPSDSPMSSEQANALAARLDIGRDVVLVDSAMSIVTKSIAQQISRLRSTVNQDNDFEQSVRVGTSKRRRADRSSAKARALQHRLEFMEFKLRELERVLQPFKNTILAPSFSKNLDSSYNLLWDIASNHHKLLATLADPAATSNGNDVEIDLQAETSPDEILSKPLMSAIQKLVQDTTAKKIRPLQDKLELMEKSLNSEGE